MCAILTIVSFVAAKVAQFVTGDAGPGDQARDPRHPQFSADRDTAVFPTFEWFFLLAPVLQKFRRPDVQLLVRPVRTLVGFRMRPQAHSVLIGERLHLAEVHFRHIEVHHQRWRLELLDRCSGGW